MRFRVVMYKIGYTELRFNIYIVPIQISLTKYIYIYIYIAFMSDNIFMVCNFRKINVFLYIMYCHCLTRTIWSTSCGISENRSMATLKRNGDEPLVVLYNLERTTAGSGE